MYSIAVQTDSTYYVKSLAQNDQQLAFLSDFFFLSSKYGLREKYAI